MTYKIEGNKLKGVAEMEKPSLLVNAPKHLERRIYEAFSPKWKAYLEHINSLPVYDIIPSEWEGIKEVNEGEFYLQSQAYMSGPVKGGGSWLDISNDSVCAAATRVIARPKPAQGKNMTESCNKSCGPSDYYMGGKCDDNGCYEYTHADGVKMKQEIERLKGLLFEIMQQAGRATETTLSDYDDRLNKIMAIAMKKNDNL